MGHWLRSLILFYDGGNYQRINHYYQVIVIIFIYWRAEASLPCLLNYPNFRYIYIYIYLFIYIFQAVRRARTVNALRANVYMSDRPVEIQWSI